MVGRAAMQQLAQRAALGIRERVIGHQPLGGDAVLKEPVQRARGERGDGVGAFVVVQLAVGKP
jgi:hypothetical protein